MANKMVCGNIFFEREIRDPIYGYIFLTNYECKILDSEIFQRLDRILQMPTAHFVYPSAKHTRKTHSLGTMHLGSRAILNILYRQSRQKRKFLSALCWGEPVVAKSVETGLMNFDQPSRGSWWSDQSDEQRIQNLRIAAMLHDIGHAPLSHLFEDVCKEQKIRFKYKGRNVLFDHELMSARIIEEKEKELGFKAPFKSDDISAILRKPVGGVRKGKAPPFLQELVSSAYDCDKLDYLARDAYATGAIEFGAIDFQRVIDGMRVSDKETLCISSSALDALMKSFDAVQYMYTTVYYHKTVRVFDFMIAEALSKIPNFLRDIVSNMDNFLKIDDYCFLNEARNYAIQNKNKDAIQLLDDIRYRRKKYKDVFSYRISIDHYGKPVTERQLRKLKKDILKEAKNLEIRVDYRPGIRPVGINMKDFPVWLEAKNIYDTQKGKITRLKDICLAYHRRLTLYVILFRIYANRNQLKNDPTGIFNSEKDKIVDLARDKLEQMDRMYESSRTR